MKIGVCGASGHLGSATIAHLLARQSEHQIIAISRTPASVHGLEARHGNYDEPETLLQAYAGLDRLLIIPTPEVGRGRRAMQNVTAINAAVAADIKHVCFISSAGTRNVPEPDMWASYFVAEQRLMRDARSWTILRANYFTEAFMQQAQISLNQGVLAGLEDSRVAFVARDDIAAAAAGLLTSASAHAGAIYNLTGPQALCGQERAALISMQIGKQYHYLPMSESALRENYVHAGLPDSVIHALVSIQTRFREGSFDIVTGDVAMLSGKAPTPVGEILTRSLVAR